MRAREHAKPVASLASIRGNVGAVVGENAIVATARGGVGAVRSRSLTGAWRSSGAGCGSAGGFWTPQVQWSRQQQERCPLAHVAAGSPVQQTRSRRGAADAGGTAPASAESTASTIATNCRMGPL